MKLENIKIIFIDIDGTLVDDNKAISIATKKAIKRITDKGILVVITSGRDLLHTIDKSISSNSSSLVIATGGSLIYDYGDNRLIFSDFFEYSKVISVWNYCISNKIGLIIKTTDGVYCNIRSRVEYKYINDISVCKKSNISQFLIMTDSYEKMESVRKYVCDLGMFITSLSSSYLESRNADYYSIDVNNSNVSKGTAISFLLDYLNIKKEESLCFGDYINDIDMFNACGYSVAMGNACDEIKNIANFVTKSNNDDGIAYFLDNYL